MRILIVGNSHRAEIRGPIVYYQGLAKAVRDRGHDVTLLQSAHPEHRFTIEGVRSEYFTTTKKSRFPFLFGLRRLGRYDVLHTNGPSGALFALRNHFQHVPMVSMFHAPRLRMEPFLRTNWRWRYIQITAQNSPNLLTPTRWLATALSERFNVPLSRFHVIPLGVQDWWFEVDRQPIAPGRTPLRVAVVNMKGVDIALRAFAKAAGGRDVHLDLYGVDKAEKENRALAGELGIAESVTFHGFVPNEKLVQRLCEADVLLHANRSGNMDQVLCEAQVMGLPTVTSNVHGNPEIVLDGKTGLLCPVDHVDAFASSLGQMLDQPELRVRFSEAARRRAPGVWRWARVAERLEQELYIPISRGEPTHPRVWHVDPSQADPLVPPEPA
jgi:glycosyltransferase involved in cell wall biosynthesis